MKAVPADRHSSLFRMVLVGAVLLASGITISCGSSSQKTPPFNGNTQVTVLLSSTANDQLSEFDLGFQSITLTSQSGKTVTLASLPASGPPLDAEFMHLNGTAQPLLTATIPQDIYSSATVTLGGGAFVCLAVGQVNGQPTLSTATYTLFPPTATVNLPSPLTVTGTSMALSLDLLVSQSGGAAVPVGLFETVGVLIPGSGRSLTSTDPDRASAFPVQHQPDAG